MKPLSKEEFMNTLLKHGHPCHEVVSWATKLYAEQLEGLKEAQGVTVLECGPWEQNAFDPSLQPCTHPNLWPNGSGQLKCECGREMHAHKANANGYCEVCGDPAPQPKGSKVEEFRRELDAQVASSLPGLTSDLACTLFEKFMGEQLAEQERLSQELASAEAGAMWQEQREIDLRDVKRRLTTALEERDTARRYLQEGAKEISVLNDRLGGAHKDRDHAIEERDRAKEALVRTQVELFNQTTATEKLNTAHTNICKLATCERLEKLQAQRDAAREQWREVTVSWEAASTQVAQLEAERDSLRGELGKLQAERESLISTERDRIWRRVQKAKDDLGQFQQFLIWLAQPSRDKLAAVIRRYRLRDRQWRQKWMAQVDAHVATGQKETALQAEVSRLTEELSSAHAALKSFVESPPAQLSHDGRLVPISAEGMRELQEQIFELKEKVAGWQLASMGDAEMHCYEVGHLKEDVAKLQSQLSLAKGLAEAVQNIYGRNPDVARMATTLNIALVRALTAFLEATKEGAGE